MVTTRPPELADSWPALPEEARDSCRTRGLGFYAGDEADFNSRIAFASPDYLRTAWAPWMFVLAHTPRGFGARDVVICRRKEPDGTPSIPGNT